MKYTKITLGALFAAVLFATSTFAAEPTGGDLGRWTLSLGGSGAVTTQTPSTFSGGTTVSIGHTGDFILPFEAGVRQGVGYSTGNNWALNTTAYSDWTLVKLGNLELDGGFNVGVAYGNTPLTWTAAPEVVGRLWLLKNVNTYVSADYPFNFTTDSFKAQDKVRLNLGLQIRF